MRIGRAVAAATGVLFFTCTALEAGPALIGLSSDGSYLVDPNGRPVFINGDTAWSLMVQPTDAQIVAYLDDRQAKGINALIASLIESKFATNAPANALGDPPFSGAAFIAPNERYFARVDWIIERAAERGITLLLAPAYLGYRCGDEGWCSAVQATSPSAMRNYGRFLGARYRDSPNIIWLIGGDADPFSYDVDGKLEEMVAGIKESDTTHLMTAHVGPGTSPQEIWGSASWLDLNNVYTYSPTGTHVKTYVEFQRRGALPLFLLESAYENERGSTALSLRTQAYQAVLWGAYLGHFFGDCPIWAFGAPQVAKYCSVGSWVEQLNSVASVTVPYIGNLMRSRRHWLMRPDHEGTVMATGRRLGTWRAVVSRAVDGSTVLAYLPTPRRIWIDMAKVSGGSARAWWWDPRSNAATDLGVFRTDTGRSFIPPTSGDWVLVIDDATLNLPPPGTIGTLPQQPPAVSECPPARDVTPVCTSAKGETQRERV